MATAEQTFPVARPGYTGLMEWITTTDHKKIGILYVGTTFFFFLMGGLLALGIRTQLATPNGTLLTAEQYNEAFTMHGTTMVFLFVVPVWTGFANYIVPLMIGARDMAFPRLNALSYWLLVAGAIVLYSAFIFGLPAAGWTSYVPLSTKPFSPGHGVDLWILGLTILGFSSIFGALNMIVTIFALRCPGLTFHRLPLFTWMVLVTSFLLVLAMPFLTVAGVLLLFDRMAGTNFFSVTEGADPLLWQYLFWFFGHPEVYIMILPGFGVISEVLPVFSGKPIFGYKMVAYSGVAIGFLSFGVFVHHMFVAGIDPALQIFFMSSTMLIAVPTGVKVFSWLGTIQFLTFFIAFNMAFYPMHQLGLEGMPRRTFHYPQSPEWGFLNLIATLGVYIIALSVALFLFNYFWNILGKHGKVADDDPWNADTLEWATSSPPPAYNFARIPVVHSARPLKEDIAH